jgi:hypothetical protein
MAVHGLCATIASLGLLTPGIGRRDHAVCFLVVPRTCAWGSGLRLSGIPLRSMVRQTFPSPKTHFITPGSLTGSQSHSASAKREGQIGGVYSKIARSWARILRAGAVCSLRVVALLVTERLALAQESGGTEEQRVACTNAWEIRKH